MFSTTRLWGKPYPQGEAALASGLGGKGLLSHGRRMPGIGGRHRAAQADALRLSPYQGQNRDGVEAKDVRQPQVVEPGPLRPFGRGDQIIERPPDAVRSHHDSHAHEIACSAASLSAKGLRAKTPCTGALAHGKSQDKRTPALRGRCMVTTGM